MLVKFSSLVSVFTLSVVLASVLPTSSWSMEEEEIELPIENAIRIVRNISKKSKDRGAWGVYIIPNFEDLCRFRLLSHKWKSAADDVIIKDKLLNIPLRPDNYKHAGLKDIASLATTITLAHWNEDNSLQIGDALSKHQFPNVLKLKCFHSGDKRLVSRDIGENGGIALASVLKNFPQLQDLSFRTSIGEKGGKAMGEALYYLPELRKILISGRMGPIGTMEFAEGLNHPHLVFLDLCGNGAGDIGCVALAKKLKNLPSLETLLIGNMVYSATPGGESRYIQEAGNIQEAGKKYFEAMVKEHNPNLKYDLEREKI
ncbi:MAG: hypothetical protein H0X26_01070 [Alphaproteobacteria bacterium]|nr:hypothetical protein [Alphaproteobacteria bacterium]